MIRDMIGQRTARMIDSKGATSTSSAQHIVQAAGSGTPGWLSPLQQLSIPSPPLSLTYRHQPPLPLHAIFDCPAVPPPRTVVRPRRLRLACFCPSTAVLVVELPHLSPFLSSPCLPLHCSCSFFFPVFHSDGQGTQELSVTPMLPPVATSPLGTPYRHAHRRWGSVPFYMPFQICMSHLLVPSPARRAPAWGRDDSRDPAPTAVVAAAPSGPSTYRGYEYG